VNTARPRSLRVPKRAWAVLALTLVALPVLGWLQLNLTEDAAKAQAYQMKQRLVAAAAQANSAIEVERLVLREFVHDLRLPRKSSTTTPHQAVTGALQFWRERTSAPGILKGVWLAAATGADYLDAKTGAWSRVPLSQVPAPIAEMVKGLDEGEEPDPAFFIRGFFPAEPVRFSPSMIMVPDADLDAVVSTLVPQALSQAFGGALGMADLSLTVKDRLDGRVVYQGGPTPGTGVEPAVTQSLWDVGGLKPLQGLHPTSPLLRLWLHQTTDDSSRWCLEVRLAKGSIDEVFEQIRWTNLAVSLTLLVVLGAGILLLFALYSRSRRMVRAQNSFVAAVSHELRTPLAVMRSAAENLKEGLVTGPDQAVRYGARLLEESDRLLQMTENVLWYSGIGAQRVTVGDAPDRWTAIDVGSLVTHAAAPWAEAFTRDGARLDVDPGPGGLVVNGDRSALKAIVDNLLSNALRYGVPAPGHVVISVASLDAKVRIEVKDKGPGIPRRERRRLFEPFYQTATGSTGGIGLGLSLVQRIAVAHGGDARIVGVPGWGTVVQVDLPAGGPL
jgi:signal transduction histidine kinase